MSPKLENTKVQKTLLGDSYSTCNTWFVLTVVCISDSQQLPLTFKYNCHLCPLAVILVGKCEVLLWRVYTNTNKEVSFLMYGLTFFIGADVIVIR